ncbi:hotdog fold thioesterase [Marinigracilibium pacificum]|uniref:Hotdog fold thioesterase n=1 Tax=Marinigracilibium pacificum TaxID=2729599 RepID=A0A848J094_9BACT|nr:hotdog fold thioesterase [Marinigracilibium pacificum]NMM47970.1 hotdog fold thioesterase [Marinigracilibium pacificum]
MTPLFSPDIKIEDLNAYIQDTMISTIGIEFTQVTESFIEAKVPVDSRTVQPYGLLHGGASVALAETLGSMASQLLIDETKQYCVGLEINANHVRGARSGFVVGRAKAIHIGRTTHIWSIEIKNEEDKLVCISRLTVAVINKK